MKSWYETKHWFNHWTKTGLFLRKRIVSRVGRILQMASRFCYSWSLDRCICCGRAVGMEPMTKGGCFCWSCYNEWSKYMGDGFTCDWRGMGRVDDKGLLDKETTDDQSK
jgi:hypothetical protein